MAGKTAGAMVISLDFELLWGVVDHHNIHTYGRQILGARLAIEKILEVFEQNGIHATWAVVGFLFCKDKNDLQKHISLELPQYEEMKYSAYSYIKKIKTGEEAYYFAPDLIKRIQDTPNQEIASHTFSHYYCLEQGQTDKQFEADMRMYIDVSSYLGECVHSIVFPRNQFNSEYEEILQRYGIRNYRGTEKSWCYRESEKEKEHLAKRGLRWMDAYLNVFGHHCYSFSELNEGSLCNIRSSRFFRPYNHRLSKLESMKIHRIKGQMKYAAKNGKVFHLWWHPHNFGIDIEENIRNLEEILASFQELKKKYGFLSMSMEEAGNGGFRSCI